MVEYRYGNPIQSFGQGLEVGNALQQLRQREENKRLVEMASGGDKNALAQLALQNPEASKQIYALNQPQRLFESSSFEGDLANAQALAYMNKQGLSQNDAILKAGSDVLVAKPTTYRDAMGNIVTISANRLPPITSQEHKLLKDVVDAAPEDRPQIYKNTIVKAKELGMPEGALPEEYIPELHSILTDVVTNAPIEDAPTPAPETQPQPQGGGRQMVSNVLGTLPNAPTPAPVAPSAPVSGFNIPDLPPAPEGGISNSPIALAKRAELSETRRADLIAQSDKSAENAVNIQPQIQGIKGSLDSLVSSGQTTGVLAPMTSFLNSLGSQLGLPANLTQASTLEQVRGYSNAISIPLVKQLGVNPTDSDLKIIQSTLSNIGTTMKANYSFVDVADQVAKRNIALNGLVRDADSKGYNEQTIKKLTSEFNSKNPIKAPKEMPLNPKDLKNGNRYATDKGIYIYNGKSFIKAE